MADGVRGFIPWLRDPIVFGQHSTSCDGGTAYLMTTTKQRETGGGWGLSIPSKRMLLVT
jgi:hypothetical protein